MRLSSRALTSRLCIQVSSSHPFFILVCDLSLVQSSSCLVIYIEYVLLLVRFPAIGLSLLKWDMDILSLFGVTILRLHGNDLAALHNNIYWVGSIAQSYHVITSPSEKKLDMVNLWSASKAVRQCLRFVVSRKHIKAYTEVFWSFKDRVAQLTTEDHTIFFRWVFIRHQLVNIVGYYSVGYSDFACFQCDCDNTTYHWHKNSFGMHSISK